MFTSTDITELVYNVQTSQNWFTVAEDAAALFFKPLNFSNQHLSQSWTSAIIVDHFGSTALEPIQFATAMEFLVTFEKKINL